MTPDRILAHYQAGVTPSVAATVTGVSPGSGPVSGGTSVTITGSGFTGLTAVNFGATAASSFTVNGDTSITATAQRRAGHPHAVQPGGQLRAEHHRLGLSHRHQISCTTGAPDNTGTLTDTAGGSGLQFDSATGIYTYVWKASKSWAGTCQQFDLRLNDGTDHIANFQFK